MDKFKKAIAELVSAITENQRAHGETLKDDDAESRKRYKDSYERVKAAKGVWKELIFKPGSAGKPR